MSTYLDYIYSSNLKRSQFKNKCSLQDILHIIDILRTFCTVHLEANSHRTNPQAYMSIRKNESLVKFIAPSKTSGAIYRRVPTYK